MASAALATATAYTDQAPGFPFHQKSGQSSVIVVTSNPERMFDPDQLHAWASEISVRQDLAGTIASIIDGSIHCDLLFVHVDHCGADLPVSIDNLLALRQSRPVPTIVCSERFSETGFVPHRLAISDASLRLPLKDGDIEVCIQSAEKGFDAFRRRRVVGN